MKTLYVNPGQRVSITCDHCGGTHAAKVPLHIRGNTPVKARCRCGNAVDVIFEFRQAYRKPTCLRGLWQKHVTDVVGRAAQIRNLSQSGLKFSTRWWRDIHDDDVLILTFTLDNVQRSTIHKQILVKYIDNQMIGAQFCLEDQFSYQKEIGFYLMR
jgi:hypothetical protein